MVTIRMRNILLPLHIENKAMNLIDIIFDTPWWVWVLFVYLLIVGIKATKTQVIPLWRVALMPSVFLLWSLYSLLYRCAACPLFIAVWILGLIPGLAAGSIFSSRIDHWVDSQKLVHLQGTIVPLALSMIFFLLKYALGVMYALNPALSANVVMVKIDTLTSSLITGLFVGQFLDIVQKYRKNSQVI